MGGLAQGQIEPDLVLGHAQVLAERLDVQRQQRGLAGRAQRQPDVGRADHLARQHSDRLPDLLTEHGAAHGAHHADQRARHGLHLLGQHIAHGRADPLGDRVDELLPRGQGRLDPLGAAPGHGGVRRRKAARSRRPATGRPAVPPPRPPARSAGPTLASFVPSGVPWATVCRAMCLAMSQFTGTALVAEHLPELLEGGAQVVGVQRTEHRRERIVRTAQLPGSPNPKGLPGRLPAPPSAVLASCPRRRPPAPPAEGRIRMGCHSRVSSARRAAGSTADGDCPTTPPSGSG